MKEKNKLQDLTFFFLLLFIICSCNNSEDPARFYHPAEFEPTNSTGFIWSIDHKEIIPKLIGIISAKDQVTIYIDGNVDDLATVQKILEKYGSNFQNIHFFKLNKKPDNIWIRDFGPVYLINKLGEKKLVNFTYFGTNFGFIEQVNSQLKLPVIPSSLNSTGGSREVNGKGTIILCEAHELDVNKPKTKPEVEKEIIEKLALKKVIWLKKGIPQDDNPLEGPIYEQIYPNGIKGHIDEFCRFVDPHTILISSVTDEEAKQHPIYAEAKRRLDENYTILVNSSDQDGKKFNVIKVPFAPVRIIDRSTASRSYYISAVTSYMNFIITNSMVIVPSYVSENLNKKYLVDKEDEVKNIFKKVFPSKQIIMVQAEVLNYFSGGFHCISINEPLVKK